ncbi:hypothetical protein [Bifidobacterium aemilianum]|uniref:hypothetical protein n=1 Tax=Bifidobacterium aemilianum TaxID=2493120 RepID=UPI000FDEEFCF|nr:hypothetical protein [Bifidobacterium aemilianum]
MLILALVLGVAHHWSLPIHQLHDRDQCSQLDVLFKAGPDQVEHVFDGAGDKLITVLADHEQGNMKFPILIRFRGLVFMVKAPYNHDEGISSDAFIGQAADVGVSDGTSTSVTTVYLCNRQPSVVADSDHVLRKDLGMDSTQLINATEQAVRMMLDTAAANW